MAFRFNGGNPVITCDAFSCRIIIRYVTEDDDMTKSAFHVCHNCLDHWFCENCQPLDDFEKEHKISAIKAKKCALCDAFLTYKPYRQKSKWDVPDDE
jgi:hypothetical protein